ncbi:hypothetical protein RB195_025749 [Necator americanus]|uniref:Reverse transcriptase domain-containing protein n=1 Tax=Necator americanus TaxID=51031 RepID=A0ABR1ETP5_NECAM
MTKITALRIPDETTTASRNLSDLCDSYAHLPSHHLEEDGHVIWSCYPRGLPFLKPTCHHVCEESLYNQDIPTLCITVLRKLYSNFTTKASPVYNATVDVKKAVRQNDTILPKIFTVTLKNAMRGLEWDEMEVKLNGREIHHFCFADDIILLTLTVSDEAATGQIQ